MTPQTYHDALWTLDEWAADPHCIDPRTEYVSRSIAARWVMDEAVVVYDPDQRRWIGDDIASHDLESATSRAIALRLRLAAEADARHAAKSAVNRAKYAQRPRVDVADLRRRVADPWRVVAALGIEKNARRQRTGVLVRCPAHDDRTGSFSITVANGTLRCHCFGCHWSGDVLALVALVHGLSLKSDFRRVCERAMEMAA